MDEGKEPTTLQPESIGKACCLKCGLVNEVKEFDFFCANCHSSNFRIEMHGTHRAA